MAKIKLPHNYEPREYQKPFFEAMDSGYRRAILVWHRRAGKDKACLNFTVNRMPQRVGSYYYLFPEAFQGRKVLWDGADKSGFRFLNHFPRDYIAGEPNNTEMKLRTQDGSLFQIIGTDNFDSAMGTNPVGMVFSEYSLQNPRAYGYFRPILAENGGWAIFNFTPRGENHAYDLWGLAQSDKKNWYSQLLTVDDTKAISPEVLEQERREIVRLDGNDALFQQEYYCNFTVPISGAYYADHLMRAYQEGRVGVVPVDPRYLVDTWWDLGVGTNMAIWFVQHVGAEVRFVDYMQGGAFGLIEYIKRVREKGYQFGKHIGPHDLASPEISNGKTRIETAQQLGFQFEVCPKLGILDGIEAAANMFPLCRFDKDRCADGLNALKNYRRQFDEKRKMYMDVPYHDWASHGADAFRTGAVAVDFQMSGRPVKRDAYEEGPPRSAFNPMTV
jgi:phage terminase large subunit